MTSRHSTMKLGKVNLAPPQLMCLSVSDSLTFLLFALYNKKYGLWYLLCITKNVSKLNMFTFDSFSVCHLLSQTLIGYFRIKSGGRSSLLCARENAREKK